MKEGADDSMNTGRNPRTALPRWYGPVLGVVWALLIIQVMLPFPANVAVATLSAALAGFFIGLIEAGGTGDRRANPHGGAPLVLLLGLLGLSLFLYYVADIAQAPPLLGLVAFVAAWAHYGRAR